MKSPRGSPRRTLPPEAVKAMEFKRLQEQAENLHVRFGEREEALLRRYLYELLRWNQKINLISVSTLEELLVRHVVDSLVPVRFLEEAKVVVDVGSGAGFPAIPIKIARPALKIHLLEARRKRVSFLQYVTAVLELDGVEVVWGRLEADSGAPGQMRGPADCILTRASGAEEAILKVSESVLKAGGRIVLMKGAVDTRQRTRLEQWAKEKGRRIALVYSYRLPGVLGERNLVLFE